MLEYSTGGVQRTAETLDTVTLLPLGDVSIEEASPMTVVFHGKTFTITPVSFQPEEFNRRETFPLRYGLVVLALA